MSKSKDNIINSSREIKRVDNQIVYNTAWVRNRESQATGLDNRGFTLLEVISAILLSTLLIGMAAVAIFTFYTKFNELSLYSRLQQDAFHAVENMKYGYPVELGHQEYYFYGIANARSVTLPETGGELGTSHAIRINPGVDEDLAADGYNPWVQYYFDRYERRIMVRGLVGPRPPGRSIDTQLFPPRGSDHLEVMDLSFTTLTGIENIRVVELSMTARVVISDDRARYVTYRTRVALGR